MRIVFVYLTLLALVLVSLGAGFVASDWPRWCTRAHWCNPDWPRHREPAVRAHPTADAGSPPRTVRTPLSTRL